MNNNTTRKICLGVAWTFLGSLAIFGAFSVVYFGAQFGVGGQTTAAVVLASLVYVTLLAIGGRPSLKKFMWQTPAGLKMIWAEDMDEARRKAVQNLREEGGLVSWEAVKRVLEVDKIEVVAAELPKECPVFSGQMEAK